MTGWTGCGCDEDFADWYPRDGCPGLSPARLATICAAVLVRPVGPAGDRGGPLPHRLQNAPWPWSWTIPASTTACWHGFRERLTQSDRTDRLLDLALARLKNAGLVRERTIQGTDSTQVLASVRDMTRLELIIEAVRAALEEPHSVTTEKSDIGLASRRGAAAPSPQPAGTGSPQPGLWRHPPWPLCKAIADPVRLRLLSMIACHDGGQACVCDLTDAFDLTAPTISHHLKVLKQARLIDSERRGTWVYYWITQVVLERLSVILGPRLSPAPALAR